MCPHEARECVMRNFRKLVGLRGRDRKMSRCDENRPHRLLFAGSDKSVISHNMNECTHAYHCTLNLVRPALMARHIFVCRMHCKLFAVALDGL